MKAAQAAAIAAAAQQEQKKQKEQLWEDQACMRCGSKVKHFPSRDNPSSSMLSLLASFVVLTRGKMLLLDKNCSCMQEDGPDTEEGLMLLCDGCNKGMHMKCVLQTLQPQPDLLLHG